MAYHPFRHLGLKFIAVAVALGLWFTVAGEETVERNLAVPLELQNRSEQLELVGTIPTTVHVRVRGRAGIVSQLDPGAVRAMLDLTSAKPGRRHFVLSRQEVRVPFGVEVVEVSPTNVTLRFERSMRRRVTVVPVIEGDPAAGYVAGRAMVNPGTVDIAGPESAVEPLKEVATEPVSVAGARGTVRESVAIGVPDPAIRMETAAAVLVTVPIDPVPVERLLTQVPVHLRNPGRGLTAQAVPAAIAVTVRGPSELVASLRPDSISAFVDLASLGAGRYNLSVAFEPGQGFAVVRAAPSTVSVRVK